MLMVVMVGVPDLMRPLRRDDALAATEVLLGLANGSRWRRGALRVEPC